jgi:hypothetical protein
VVLQVLLLPSSGVASIWQASTPAFQQQLQQHHPTAAAKALAELAGSAVPIRDLGEALQQQLEGLEEGAAGQAAAATQRCSVGHTCMLLLLRCSHVVGCRNNCVSPADLGAVVDMDSCQWLCISLMLCVPSGAACARDHHAGEVPAA